MPDDRTAPSGRARIGNSLILGLVVAGLLLVAADLVVERHPHFEIEHWTGFYGLAGAAAAAAGIVLALALRRIATRPEDRDAR
jgi:uncharacterized membrane protein